jgi:hypothetical protein
MDELVAFVRARLNEREALLLHTRASGIPCPIPIDTLLAEVEAKRRILDLCAPGVDEGTSGARVARLTIHLLAQPYAGQHGWREEWAL